LGLSEELTYDQWQQLGVSLARLERTANWWIGDWWIHSDNNRYGDRKALVESGDWTGPTFQACMDAGCVARKFGTSRRHEVLSFTHHRVVAALEPAQADELLSWCEEPLKAGSKKPRSVEDLENRVREIRCPVDLPADHWTKTAFSKRETPEEFLARTGHLPEKKDAEPTAPSQSDYDSKETEEPIGQPLTEQELTDANAAAQVEEASFALCCLRVKLEDSWSTVSDIEPTLVPAVAWEHNSKACRQALRKIEKFLDDCEQSPGEVWKHEVLEGPVERLTASGWVPGDTK
jgi:hypothetical protein